MKKIGWLVPVERRVKKQFVSLGVFLWQIIEGREGSLSWGSRKKGKQKRDTKEEE